MTDTRRKQTETLIRKSNLGSYPRLPKLIDAILQFADEQRAEAYREAEKVCREQADYLAEMKILQADIIRGWVAQCADAIAKLREGE